MDYFLQLFGNVPVWKVVTIIGAAIFLSACYRKVDDYFTKKALRQKERDDSIRQVIEQAKLYPVWHRQSIDIRDQLNSSIQSLEEKIDAVNETMRDMKKEGEEDRATNWRYRILRFNDEVLHDNQHTKEHFDQILEDVGKYERYCDGHPEFENNKAKTATENIQRVYKKCLHEKTFL